MADDTKQFHQEVRDWQERIRQATHEREPHRNTWKKLHSRIHGPMFRAGPKDPETSRSPVNRYNSYAKIIKANLVPRDRNLKIVCQPNRPGPQYEESAELLSDRLTGLVRAIKFYAQLRRAVQASIYSEGYLLQGFEVSTGIIEEVPTHADPQKTTVVNVDQERVGNQEYLDAGLPFSMWVPAPKLFFDRGATELSDARWCAIKICRSLESLKVDPKFAEAAEGLQPTGTYAKRDFDDGDDGGGKEDPKLAIVEFFQVYDRAAQKVFFIPGEKSGYEKQIAEPSEWPAGIEGFPLARIVYEQVEGFYYANPPLSPSHDLFRSLDIIMRHLIRNTYRSKRIGGYDPGELTPAQVAGIQNSADGAWVPIPGLKSGSAQVLDTGGTHPDQWNMFGMIKAEADELSGIGEFQRGGTPGGGATATEVQARMQHASVLMEDMSGVIKEAVSEAVSQLAALMIVHQDMMGDVHLPIQDGNEQRFVALSGQPVIGEYLHYGYDITSGVERRIDPAVREKREQDLIGQSMDPNLSAKLQQEGKQFLTAPLLEKRLRSMGETNPERYLIDLPPPDNEQEQEVARQEDQQMLQSGQAIPVSPGENHEAHMQIHNADYQQTQSEAIMEHLYMHEQLQQQQQQQASGGGSAPGTGQSPTAGTAGGAQQAGAELGAARRT